MSTTETPTPIPPELDRITLVLRAGKVESLDNFRKNAKLGGIVMIDSSVAYIAGLSEGDLQMVLGQERDERWMQAQLQEEALGAPAHLAAHAQEMFDLLHRINVKVGGLNAVVGHGGEPSEQMWEEHDEAMDAIWDLLAKVKSAASVDKVHVNQIAETHESVNQQQNALQNIPEIIPGPADPMHIDDRVRMIGDEPTHLTVVFKLPSLNDAQPLIAQLPYGQKALGTEAVVFGMTTGNLMEDGQ